MYPLGLMHLRGHISRTKVRFCLFRGTLDHALDNSLLHSALARHGAKCGFRICFGNGRAFFHHRVCRITAAALDGVDSSASANGSLCRGGSACTKIGSHAGVARRKALVQCVAVSRRVLNCRCKRRLAAGRATLGSSCVSLADVGGISVCHINMPLLCYSSASANVL